ncbi:MAG: glycoside hydrolase family 25 protein [Bacteroidaceae bacterium]|nr:glycoside hydrolase family 25 protein [Bacteroidaceae bacterium]
MAEKKKNKYSSGGQKATPSARRSSSSPKRKHMPHWQYIVIATIITAIALFFAYHLFIKRLIYTITPCEGLKIFSTCIPKGYSVYGIDVSRHQGEIDWNTLASENSMDAPITFVYMKATEGSDHKDIRFDYNWENAKKHGFMRGAYHYFSTHSTGLAQANMFIKTVNVITGDLPPVVDVEEKPDNKVQFMQELKIFISKIQEHYGVKPMIYTYKKYKERYLDDRFFDNYPTWIAHYYVDSLAVSKNWTMWQCSDKGELPGIGHKVDINIFNGEIDKLENLRIK